MINKALIELGTSPVSEDISLEQLLKRPEVTYDLVNTYSPPETPLNEDIEKQVEIQTKYEGYISRQKEMAERLKKMEEKKIPEGLDYSSIRGLSKEILCKLAEIRPVNLGQAGRIQGMTPAALSLIMVAVEKVKRSR
jgi:tRNA uridine 5-carboxymethylaminomethyl modification enzyme